MTREEILEYLNYKGKYTKDVKKKLNKLLKKYHPDNNKDDKDTILVLYQIKKELEDGSLEYSKKSSKKEYDFSFVLELMIKRLKSKKDRIDKKIESLYEKLNLLYQKINSKQDEMSLIDTDISELEDEIYRLLKVDYIDIIIFLSIMLMVLFMIVFRNYLFIFGFLILIFVEVYYINMKKKLYYEKMNKLKNIKKVRKSVYGEYKFIKDKVTYLEEDELELKKEKNRVNNDISYYSHQLNNINNKDLSKEDEYVDDNKKGFVKR